MANPVCNFSKTCKNICEVPLFCCIDPDKDSDACTEVRATCNWHNFVFNHALYKLIPDLFPTNVKSK